MPEIVMFQASKALRDSIDPINLSWKVSDAVKINISSINKDFNSTDDTYVEPLSDTTYKLTALGNFDEVIEKSLDIEVIKLQIDSFDLEG